MNKKILIQLVVFNKIEWSIKSINSIPDKYLVYVYHNASNNQLRYLMKSEDNVKIMENPKNIGFSKAHNIIFNKKKADYHLVLNPDTILSKDFVHQLLESMRRDQNIGMVSGKLLRCSEDAEPLNVIDSTGLVVKKSRQAFDRGQGEEDRGQYDEPEYIFGCSGAAVLYRREMLEDIAIDGEYFDEDFFAYKEDVDLAWRAQLRGWKAYYNPKAVIYHARGWKEKSRKEVPRFVRIHSFKNRYLMLLKNDTVLNILKDLPGILLYEFAAFIYVLFREPFLLKAYLEVIRLLPKMLRKRKKIMAEKKVLDQYIRKWFI